MLDGRDYRDGRLWIRKARKGQRLDSPLRGTKGVRLGGRQPKLTRSGIERARRRRCSGHSLRAIDEKLEVSLGTAHAAVHGTAKVKKA